jgi:DNA-binding MurR/RpiR family transcriptional regulator
VQQAADEIGVSPAAIIRYVKKIGYRGFPEFVLAMETYSAELQTAKDNEGDTLFGKVVGTYMNTLERTQSLDFDKNLAEVAELIVKTDHVKSIGIGSSGLPAEQLVYSLYLQDLFIESVTTNTKIFYLTEILDKSYLIIIYSMSGNDEFYDELMTNAKKVGAKTIVVTMNPDSKLGERATKQFLLPNGETEISDTGSLYQVDNRLVFFVFSEALAYYVRNVREKNKD